MANLSRTRVTVTSIILWRHIIIWAFGANGILLAFPLETLAT